MVHAKDKELTEALVELSKAKDLLANLGVPNYADPKGPIGTSEPQSFLKELAGFKSHKARDAHLCGLRALTFSVCQVWWCCGSLVPSGRDVAAEASLKSWRSVLWKSLVPSRRGVATEASLQSWRRVLRKSLVPSGRGVAA
ncbi:hypothetical protein Fot_11658 [Forsythia ovata]|uniref:Uncharacterized protein n=1 Tax=Forsythia ovata TaxID=205694 RepID=A0ABD1WN60_9LAMI